jgi:ribonuclease BN (tRNA processing enzyme)
MKIVFLGVGEAFDENLDNTSILVDSNTKLLLDCGYSIPRQLWRNYPDRNFLDAIYLSHAHADHYLGVPMLLARMWEENRSKRLKIICHPSIREDILLLIDLAHRGLFVRLPFSVDFVECDPAREIALNELKLSFAATNHSVSNLAIRISWRSKSICYSGDGNFTEESVRMYRGANLLIHEAYTLEEQMPTHGSCKNVIEMADDIGVKHLALVHVNREVRKRKDEIWDFIGKQTDQVNVMLPEPLEEFEVVE